jgi:hypothetical protein
MPTHWIFPMFICPSALRLNAILKILQSVSMLFHKPMFLKIMAHILNVTSATLMRNRCDFGDHLLKAARGSQLLGIGDVYALIRYFLIFRRPARRRATGGPSSPVMVACYFLQNPTWSRIGPGLLSPFVRSKGTVRVMMYAQLVSVVKTKEFVAVPNCSPGTGAGRVKL